tara:strand:+ start:398 stop:673 length:276 start_codon:yes stop_codon:yes gene_type:complete
MPLTPEQQERFDSVVNELPKIMEQTGSEEDQLPPVCQTIIQLLEENYEGVQAATKALKRSNPPVAFPMRFLITGHSVIKALFEEDAQPTSK